MLATLLLLGLAAARAIAPGHLVEVRGAGGAVLVLQARVGVPPRDVRLAAVGANGDVVLSGSPAATSFSAAIDGPAWTDLLHIADAHLRVPIRVDAGAVYAVCPSCDGLIGLGGPSPLWALWRHVEISDAGLRLDETTRRAEALGDGVVAWADCAQPSQALCETEASAEGFTFPFLIAPTAPRTVLPNDVFHALRGGRTLADDWPDLRLALSRGGGSRDHRYDTSLVLRIPGRQIARHALGEPDVLTVARGGATGSLGWEALRAGAIVRDWNGGRAAWVPRVTERNETVPQAIAAFVLWVALLYAKETRPLFRLRGQAGAEHPWSVAFDIAVDVLALAAAPLFVWQRGTWAVVLRGAPWLPTAALFLYPVAAFWLVVSIAAQAAAGRRASPASTVRALVAREWARDVLLLLGLWFVLLATSGDRPRSLGLAAVWAWWCACVGMAAAGALAGTFTRAPFTPDWPFFLASAGAATAAWTAYTAATFLPALTELASAYFYLSWGLTTALGASASVALGAYVGGGRAVSLFNHLNGQAGPRQATRAGQRT